MKYLAILRSALVSFLSNIIVYGLKIIGLAPFSFQKTITGHNTRSDEFQLFRYSKVGSIYNFLPVIPIFGITWLNVQEILNLDWRVSTIARHIENSILISQDVFASVAACFVLIAWSLRQRKAAATLNLLHETSARLSAVINQPFEKQFIVSSMTHFTINSFVFITFSIEGVDYTSFPDFFASVLAYSTRIIIFWFAVEYFVVVGFVSRKFRAVNQCLTNYHQELDNDRFINHRDDHLAAIRLLRSVRSKLVDVCEDIADFFSLPILFCVFYSFISLFYVLFDLFKFNIEMRTIGVPVRLHIAWALLIILAYVYPVTSLTLNVTRVKTEAGLTGRIVNKLLSTTRNGSEVQVELEKFTRDLSHDNLDVFTAYGLITLDSTLLPSILAGTATYFVVLLQLLPPEHDPKPGYIDCSICSFDCNNSALY